MALTGVIVAQGVPFEMLRGPLVAVADATADVLAGGPARVPVRRNVLGDPAVYVVTAPFTGRRSTA